MNEGLELEERPASVASARASWTVGAIGAVWVVLHAAGLLDPNGEFTIVVAALTAVVSTIIGLRKWRPRPLWPWLAIAGALSLFLVADSIRVAVVTLGDLSPDRSILPDVLALPGYLILAVGVAGLAGVGRGERDDIDAVLDAVIAALAVLAIGWTYLVAPVLSEQAVPLKIEITFIAYPIASVFVLAMGARLLYARARQTPPAMWLSMAAIFSLLIGDVVFGLADTRLVEVPDNIADIPYSMAFLFYAMAVLHPSVRRVGHGRTSDEIAPTRGRLLGVAVALFVPAAVLVSGLGDMKASDRLAIGGITVLLVGVAVLRMWRALNEHAVSEARLAHQATHDSLTDLPNRWFVAEHIDVALERETEGGGSVAVLHIDLDRFKLVNDTMGYAVGDELLLAVGERLKERVRKDDIVAHIGGDEFIVVATGLEDEAHVIEFGERARLMFKAPFEVDQTEISVTASVGVAYSKMGRGSASELLRDADTALNHAKSEQGDVVALFDTSMRERVAERLHLERELRHALERDELELHYQPKLRVSDRSVVGMEALLRWNHPELGMVRPDRFIPIAEDTGMIVEIGAWVIDQACAEMARIREVMPAAANVTVSANVSARQLRSERIVDTIAQALLRHRLPPDLLCLELTESVLVKNLDAVSSSLQAIRECGTKVSIDDFGTGYSSLAYLANLPVDELKVDRTFVSALGSDKNSASLIQAVVFIASSLGITTVAEGVETEAQARAVGDLGCTELQGYLFSKPVPASELLGTLTRLGVSAKAMPGRVPAPFRRALGSIA